ncbi:hypothetical protein V6N13_121659 [Hibiscus sabdariffa]
MSLGGAEVLMATAGLWAVVLRPLMIRYAAEMIQAIGFSVGRIFTRRPLSTSSSLSLMPDSFSIANWYR